MSAHRIAATEQRTRRWPVLALIPVLIAAAILVQRHQDDQPVEVSSVSAGALMPVAPAPDAPSSTWYCAGGSATGAKTGPAEQTIEIANVSDAALTAHVTAVPDKGTIVEKDVAVPARGRQSVVLSSMVVADTAAAVVEVDGGEVAVSHLLTGPTGTTTAACSTSPSASWFFPSGNSEKASASHQLLYLFNPFPSDAVVEVTFDTDDGARAPEAFSALVVAGRSVRMLDIAGTVTLDTQIATTVTVKSGRVIADQVQFADGTQDTVKSLAVTPGAPQAWPTWWFADGPAGAGDQTTVAVQNPSDHDVDVELQIRLDDAANTGQVDPFALTVPAGRSVATNISADGRVPAGLGYTIVAVATDGTPIVASRVVTETEPVTGVTVTMGSPALASHWVVPVASAPNTSAAVVVTNPSSTDPVTVTVSSVANGADTPISTADPIEIPAGGRAGIPVPVPTDKPLTALDVVSSAPVVVEARLVFKDAGLAAPLAVPVAGSVDATTEGLPVTEDTSISLDPNATIDPNAPVDPDATVEPSPGTDDTAGSGDTADTSGAAAPPPVGRATTTTSTAAA